MERFIHARRLFTIGAAYLGGVIFYGFYVWGRVVDPADADNAHWIFVLALAVIWIAASSFLVFAKQLNTFGEHIITAVLILIVCILDVILSRLHNGYQQGVTPLVIIFLFSVAFFHVRLPWFVLFFFGSWLVFDLGETISPSYGTDVFISNNFCIGAAVILGLVATTSREIEGRKRFRREREAERAQQRIDDLLHTVWEGQVDRIKNRALDASGAPTIAISYRRADSDAIVGRIRDRLVGSFGAASIFVDIDNIPFGADFRAHIDKVFGEIDLLLAIVGPHWAERHDGPVGRIHDENDPVRVEIELAERRAVRILPVLVEGANFPSQDDVPSPLRFFLQLNAIEVRSGRDFNHHMERLVRAIDAILAGRKTPNGARAS